MLATVSWCSGGLSLFVVEAVDVVAKGAVPEISLWQLRWKGQWSLCRVGDSSYKRFTSGVVVVLEQCCEGWVELHGVPPARCLIGFSLCHRGDSVGGG